MACAHSVVPLLQIWQMSGTASPGQGFVIGGGWQTVPHSKRPFWSHLQLVVQLPEFPPPLLLPPPHASPGLHLAPSVQPVGSHEVLH